MTLAAVAAVAAAAPWAATANGWICGGVATLGGLLPPYGEATFVPPLTELDS